MEAVASPSRESILLVDDEPQVLVALEDLLSDEFVVFKAENAASALRVIEREQDIAVVLSDQRMPRMTGDELLSRVADECSAMRILVTAFADLSAVVKAVNEGRIFAYVSKPWEQEDLRLKVKKAAEQFRLGKELAYERQLLHDLMNNAPDGIYFKDAQRRFLRVNRPFSAQLGVEPEELVGRRLEDVAAPQSMIELEEVLERRVLEEGEPVLDVIRESTAEEGTRWFAENKAPVRAQGGKVMGLVGISRDITRQRTLEQQLMQTQKLEAVGQLAGGVAHDLNNLLAVIGGYGELVYQALAQDDAKREDLAELLGATRRAENLIRQLLTFSRRQVVQPVLLDLNAAVSSLEKMLRRVIGNDVQVRTSLEPGLWMLRADPNQIDQVILNLVINARDAMPRGGNLTITTRNLNATQDNDRTALTPGDYVVLEVADTGSGMSAETQRHIFEPFFTTKEVGKGTGLGLSTVYGIVQQGGGQIAVDSRIGRGTTFRIHWPRAEGGLQKQERDSKPVPPPMLHACILVVDDNAELRQMACRILRERGYRVLAAADVPEARRCVQDVGEPVDLLLTDVVMPGCSGPQLASELRQQLPQLLVLYMSGYVAESILGVESQTSGVAYIEKPFNPTSLVTKVGALLNARPQRGEST